jgi:hypothetical protein
VFFVIQNVANIKYLQTPHLAILEQKQKNTKKYSPFLSHKDEG